MSVYVESGPSSLMNFHDRPKSRQTRATTELRISAFTSVLIPRTNKGSAQYRWELTIIIIMIISRSARGMCRA